MNIIEEIKQILSGKFDRGNFRLPPNHEPAMRVSPDGARCSTCKFYNKDGGGEHGACEAEYYNLYYGTKHIPVSPSEFCSDWYDPLTK